jgi:hypothetical protein
MRAITPEELRKYVRPIPDTVIAAVNKLLQDRWGGGNVIHLSKEAVIDAIRDAEPDVSRQEIYDRKWLDFESIYRAAGWEVLYHKPTYAESWESYFEFKLTK